MNRIGIGPVLLAVGLASAVIATSGSAKDPRLIPFNAYASQAGPGIPITNGHLYTLDTPTGAMTDLGLPASNGVPLVFDPATNRLLGWASREQTHGPPTGALFDLTTMPGTLIGNAVPAGVDRGISRDPTTGKFYLLIMSDNDTALYELNTATAACRFIGYQWGLAAGSLAINSQGQAFATANTGAMILYSVNLSNGVLTPVGPLSLSPAEQNHTQALCFDSADVLWMITGGTTSVPAKLYTVNTATGKATAIRPIGVSGWYMGLAILP